MNIEALKEAHDLSLDGRDFAARQIILDVIANLEKEALAQPEQEPCCYGGIAHDCHAREGCRIVERLKAAHGIKGEA